MSTHPLVNIAVRAARAAGAVIVRYVDRVDSLRVSAKGENDFVSDVDREAERVIMDTIHRAYPEHGFLAEESGGSTDGDYVWIIDPLDGTTNFLHGFPHYAVSIALIEKGRIEHGVIFDPLRQELFTATRGAGARLNDRRIRVSNRGGLAGALLGTGFPFRNMESLDVYMNTFTPLVRRCAGVRRAGSAALDLAYVAAGRLDGFWEFGLEKWDMAAGILLVKEAGGLVTTPAGADDYMESGDIAAGNPKVIREMLKSIRPALVAPAPD